MTRFNRNKLIELNVGNKREDPQYGMIEDGEYEAMYGYPPQMTTPRILTLRLQPNHPNNLHATTSDLTTYALLG